MAFKVIIFMIASVMVSAAYGSEIKVPEGCENKIYCDIKPDQFPEKLFEDYAIKSNMLITKNKRYEGEKRSYDVNPDGNNCGTRVSIIQPFMVKTNVTMKLVVQSNIFQQWIKQTECLDNGAACFKDVLSLGYTASCTPTYGEIKLYLYDPATRMFEHASLPFPVCCSCNIKSKI